MVKKLGALFKDQSIVINNIDSTHLFIHDDLSSVKGLVEKFVSNTNCSFGHEYSFENFFILVLDDVFVVLSEETRLQNFDKLNNKLS